MEPPKVFISYSHDSDDHKRWVLKLAADLRTNGVDAILDVWDLSPGQNIAAFMQKGIMNSQRVVLVCSKNYVEKADSGAGGVGYERLIITTGVVRDIDTRKFIPVVRDNPDAKIPACLGPRLYIDFTRDDDYSNKSEELLREIHGVPAQIKPPLGSNPFSGQVSRGAATSRHVDPTGLIASGAGVLDDPWFANQVKVVNAAIAKMKLKGYIELRFSLHDTVNKSQLDLLNAVRKSEIHTFGWPIGITLENKDEYRPHPYEDGIRAEVAVTERAISGAPSYDYWALRSNGDFYLLQSFFEDQRDENKIFFNTRIVRVAESLLFAANLYENLGVAGEVKLSVRVTHTGLAGRYLTSSNPNRDIDQHQTYADISQAEIIEPIGTIRQNLVTNVQRIVEPLFMLFNFTEFRQQVYEDIVQRFEKGEVT